MCPARTNFGYCSVSECKRAAYCKGMCQMHYQQIKRRENTKVCDVPGCGAPHEARGLCSAHWQRQYKHGHIGLLNMVGVLVMDRIMAKVRIEPSGCWIFMGATAGGYGAIGIDRITKSPHVVTYEDKYGPVPPGLELHHFFCNTKLCCNPDHVKPVTRSEHKLLHFAMKMGE